MTSADTTMSADEARDLFSDAYDGTLSAEQQAAFDALLEKDSELRTEFEELKALLDETHSLKEMFREGGISEAEALEAFMADRPLPGETEPPPDLLKGVQRKIRERSRGRFYRDRFTEKRTMGWTPLILAFLMVLILGVAWFGMSYVQLQIEAESQQQSESR